MPPVIKPTCSPFGSVKPLTLGRTDDRLANFTFRVLITGSGIVGVSKIGGSMTGGPPGKPGVGSIGGALPVGGFVAGGTAGFTFCTGKIIGGAASGGGVAGLTIGMDCTGGVAVIGGGASNPWTGLDGVGGCAGAEKVGGGLGANWPAAEAFGEPVAAGGSAGTGVSALAAGAMADASSHANENVTMRHPTRPPSAGRRTRLGQPPIPFARSSCGERAISTNAVTCQGGLERTTLVKSQVSLNSHA
jgi:hypothetical protein